MGVDYPSNLYIYKLKVKDNLVCILFNAVKKYARPNKFEKRKYIFGGIGNDDPIPTGENQLIVLKKIENNYKEDQKRRNINLINQFTQGIN